MGRSFKQVGYIPTRENHEYVQHHIAHLIESEGNKLATDYGAEMGRHGLSPSVTSFSTTDQGAFEGGAIDTGKWNALIDGFNADMSNSITILHELGDIAHDYHFLEMKAADGKMYAPYKINSEYIFTVENVSADATGESKMTVTAAEGVYEKGLAILWNIVQGRRRLNVLENEHNVSKTNFEDMWWLSKNTDTGVEDLGEHKEYFIRFKDLPKFSEMVAKRQINGDDQFSFAYRTIDDEYYAAISWEDKVLVFDTKIQFKSYEDVFYSSPATKVKMFKHFIYPPVKIGDKLYLYVIYYATSNRGYTGYDQANTFEVRAYRYRYDLNGRFEEETEYEEYYYSPSYGNDDYVAYLFGEWDSTLLSYSYTNGTILLPFYLEGDEYGDSDEVVHMIIIRYDSEGHVYKDHDKGFRDSDSAYIKGWSAISSTEYFTFAYFIILSSGGDESITVAYHDLSSVHEIYSQDNLSSDASEEIIAGDEHILVKYRRSGYDGWLRAYGYTSRIVYITSYDSSVYYHLLPSQNHEFLYTKYESSSDIYHRGYALSSSAVQLKDCLYNDGYPYPLDCYHSSGQGNQQARLSSGYYVSISGEGVWYGKYSYVSRKIKVSGKKVAVVIPALPSPNISDAEIIVKQGNEWVEYEKFGAVADYLDPEKEYEIEVRIYTNINPSTLRYDVALYFTEG